jgi:hypothetical protein
MIIPDPTQLTGDGVKLLHPRGSYNDSFHPYYPNQQIRAIGQKLGVHHVAFKDRSDRAHFKRRDCHWNEAGPGQATKALNSLIHAFSSGKPMKTVAIAVPLSMQPHLTPEETISLRHLEHFLGKYDRYLIASKSVDTSLPGFGIKRFSEKFFGSREAHNNLLLSSQFYQAFQEYQYLLIYHLDALVFSDQLLQWCETNLDYIGAPWLPCQDAPDVKTPRVGNGGFSLRKIESFLKVIHSTRFMVDPTDYWQRFFASKPKYLQYLNLPRKYLKRMRAFNSVRWEISRWHKTRWQNEDHFWSHAAAKYYPEFRVASVEEGLRFAFEVAPKWCYEINDHKLPFGCHAWAKYDRKFWEPFLLQ